MLESNEVEILSKSLYTILKIEDLFKKSDFHERYAKQLFRIGQQFNNLRRKEYITSNHTEEYLKWNSQKTPDYPMTKHECLIEITTLLCSFGLTHYEFLKRFFIETLLLDELSNKTGIDIGKNPTYGTLVKAFRKLPNYDEKMNIMLDEDLRNALAHDTWYFEGTKMEYRNFKNQIIEISPTKIPQKINTVLIAYTVITTKYFQDFFPEIVEFYDKIGSRKINELFPLYGMNEE